jgi:hypothetical protein
MQLTRLVEVSPMFDHLNDLPYLLIHERLADLERERLAAEIDAPLTERVGVVGRRLVNGLGELLIDLGTRLKREERCPDMAQELLWSNRR